MCGPLDPEIVDEFKDICDRCKKDIPASGGLTWKIGKLSLCYDCYLEFPKESQNEE